MASVCTATAEGAIRNYAAVSKPRGSTLDGQPGIGET